MKVRRFTLTPLRILSIGFALVILIGGILLTLPVCSRDGNGLPFVDALFTSTSATCVTGLVLYDTYTQFSGVGQAAILCLIQVGGLGFVTVGILLPMALGKRIGLRERSLMKESIGALKIGGIVRLVRKAVFGTLLLELIGAVVLWIRFARDMGPVSALWAGVFHSVSAFCNAGFDILGRNVPFGSLTNYVGDVTVNVTIMALIVVGGLGFIVWDDVLIHRHHVRRYALHTKIVLSVTAALIALGALLFYFMEADAAFAGLSAEDRVLAALFQSVSPRTAGFNTVDLGKLSESGSILTMFLMMVGASPGSTGGGLKTTVFFVMVCSMLAYLRSRDSINVFNRKIEPQAVQRAFNSAMLYLLLAVSGALVIALQGVPASDAMFEALSAIGTVGLSKGVTPGLTLLSKVVVILLMYSGRVGSISVLMAVTDRRIKTQINHVEEKIIV